jgi:hypothetical protein
MRQPFGSRRTNAWEKISRPGARDAKRFVRFVQSVPLEIRIATSRRRSANGRCPPLDPAKTLSTVIWKLTPRTLMAFQNRDYRPSPHEVDAFGGRLPKKVPRPVPESNDSRCIKLNFGVSLRERTGSIRSYHRTIAPSSGSTWRSRRSIIFRPAALFSHEAEHADASGNTTTR